MGTRSLAEDSPQCSIWNIKERESNTHVWKVMVGLVLIVLLVVMLIWTPRTYMTQRGIDQHDLYEVDD